MLGRSVRDDAGAEAGGSMKGLSLLPVDTSFRENKTLRQVTGRTGKLDGFYASLSDTEVRGYEIHMGETIAEREIFPVITEGNVLGTYIHGIFDSPEFTGKLLEILRKRRGIVSKLPQIDSAQVRQDMELNRLADVLRESLDWDLIYRVIGI